MRSLTAWRRKGPTASRSLSLAVWSPSGPSWSPTGRRVWSPTADVGGADRPAGQGRAAMETWAGPEPFAATLAAARAGDEDAFAQLWRWAHPPLLRWLRVVAPDGAEDLASEVWVSVIRCLDSFDGGER